MQKAETSFVILSQAPLNIYHLTPTHHRHNKRSVSRFLQQLSLCINLSHVPFMFPPVFYRRTRDVPEVKTDKDQPHIVCSLFSYKIYFKLWICTMDATCESLYQFTINTYCKVSKSILFVSACYVTWCPCS